MNRERSTARPPPDWGAPVRRRAAQLGVGAGEAAELLQRLPLAAAVAGVQGDAPPGSCERRLAARALDALETYAARKRATARLARQGRL
jgi:hypothetical protein